MKILPPGLSGPLRPVVDLERTLLECDAMEEDVTDCRFTGSILTGFAMEKVELHRCRLEGCRLEGCSFSQMDFVDVEFIGCDFSGASMNQCLFLRCRFSDCKGIGTDFARSQVRHVTVERGPLRYTNWGEGHFTAVRFSECDLSEGVWLQCVPDSLEWEHCQLGGCNLCRTPLKGMDLTTNAVEGLMVTGEELRGAIVTPYQAAELARLLGVVIKEE